MRSRTNLINIDWLYLGAAESVYFEARGFGEEEVARRIERLRIACASAGDILSAFQDASTLDGDIAASMTEADRIKYDDFIDALSAADGDIFCDDVSRGTVSRIRNAAEAASKHFSMLMIEPGDDAFRKRGKIVEILRKMQLPNKDPELDNVSDEPVPLIGMRPQ